MGCKIALVATQQFASQYDHDFLKFSQVNAGFSSPEETLLTYLLNYRLRR